MECRSDGRETRTKKGARERERERERKRGEFDLIDKVDLSATRGRIYVHLASFFRRRPLAAILGPREPFVFSTTRHYPRRKRPSCAPRAFVYVSRRFSSLVFVLSLPSIFFFLSYTTQMERRQDFIALLMTKVTYDYESIGTT